MFAVFHDESIVFSPPVKSGRIVRASGGIIFGKGNCNVELSKTNLGELLLCYTAGVYMPNMFPCYLCLKFDDTACSTYPGWSFFSRGINARNLQREDVHACSSIRVFVEPCLMYHGTFTISLVMGGPGAEPVPDRLPAPYLIHPAEGNCPDMN